jgi:serine/threonine protein kinase
MVMECMPDGTLFSLLHKRKRLEENEVAYILLEICHAICYLHNNKIAHRDIKP